MRIAINTRLLKPQKLEGIGRFSLETISRIIQQHPEHEFHLIFDHFQRDLIPESKNVFHHTAFPPARRPFLFDWWFNYSVPFLLKRIQADIFISPDGHGSLRCPCPQLTIIHDLNFVHHPEFLPKRYADYWNRTTRAVVAASTRIATVSEYSQSDIATTYGISKNKIDVLCNGVNPVKNTGDSKRQPYFVFVGSLHPRKNLQHTLQAFQIFQAQHPGFQLKIVGESMFAGHENTAQAGVDYLGRIAHAELFPLLEQSSGLLMVSHFEGFGIPILEALQCNVPVLAGDNTSMPEVGGNCCLYADSNNVSEMAQKLSALLSVDTKDNAWQNERNRILEKYTWENAADLLWKSIIKTIEDVAK
ncbi:MAG: D-inositol 3-phosphate glycosyltransferase [Bacteroidota bacterium]